METQANIILNNILIAEFLGWKNLENGVFENKKKTRRTPPSCGYGTKIPIDEMNFHDSWDWIMIAVDFIETLKGVEDKPYVVNITGNCCTLHLLDFLQNKGYFGDSYGVGRFAKRDAVYLAVLRFVEWFNKQKLINNT